MHAWRRRERLSSSSSSMGVGFDDSIRRRALSKLPHLHRDFRVELNGVVLSLCVFVVLGVEVAVMFVLTVMLVGREMAGSMMETETVRKERNLSGSVSFLRLVWRLQ